MDRIKRENIHGRRVKGIIKRLNYGQLIIKKQVMNNTFKYGRGIYKILKILNYEPVNNKEYQMNNADK
jgi:hypothetical protein